MMELKKVDAQTLLEFTTEVLKSFGYPQAQADITAKVLVEADARGIPSHGVARLAMYKRNVAGGSARPAAEPEVIHETPVSLSVDGKHGIGPYISKFTMEKCLKKGLETGVCFGSVKDSNHFGIAGYWADMATSHNMIGMAFTNTLKCGIVTGGRERLLGTNPIAVAIPRDNKESFLLDMATTTVAHGKIEVYGRRKKEMPIGWAVDEYGKNSSDARHIEDLILSKEPFGGQLYLGGEGEMLGGHKGYGLALLVELLCSGLSLGTWSRYTFQGGEGSGTAHFFAVFRLDLFGDAEKIKKHVDSILTEIQNSERASGYDRIYVHGEKEWRNRAVSIKEGVSLDSATCTLLEGFAKDYNIPSLFN